MSQTNIFGSRRQISSVAVLISLFLMAACASPSGNDSDSNDKSGPLTIGVLIPLSGAVAVNGKEYRRSIDLYLAQHEGQLGGRDVKLKFADEKTSDPAAALAAARKLARDDDVEAVIGVDSSAVATAVQSVFKKAKTPLIIVNAGADEISKDVSPYVWRVSFSNCQLGEAIGKHLEENVDGSIYLLGLDYAAGTEQLKSFQDTFEAAGGKIAGRSLTPFSPTTNYQPFLSKVKQSGAKAVYSFYAGATAQQFVKQYDQFGLKDSTQLYGAGFLTEQSILPAEGSAALGVRTVLSYSPTLDNPTNKKFVEAYSGKYSKTPGLYAMQAYDGMQLLDKAFAQDDLALSEAISKVGKIDSPRGEIEILPETHSPSQPFYEFEVKKNDGKLANVKIADLPQVGKCSG